jgi:hypothetical protein
MYDHFDQTYKKRISRFSNSSKVQLSDLGSAMFALNSPFWSISFKVKWDILAPFTHWAHQQHYFLNIKKSFINFS